MEKDEENGCEKAAERKLDAPNESTVLGLPLRSPLESEQECEAPPPGSSAKLLTANGHFVRDSSPPRVTISSRASHRSRLFSFASTFRLTVGDRSRGTASFRKQGSRIWFQVFPSAKSAVLANPWTDKQCRSEVVLCVSSPLDSNPSVNSPGCTDSSRFDLSDSLVLTLESKHPQLSLSFDPTCLVIVPWFRDS